MSQEYEIVPHRHMPKVNLFGNRILYRSNHMHSDFELVYVLEGTGECHTLERTYVLKPGAMVLLGSGEPHDISGDGAGVTLLLLQFSRSFLQEYIPSVSSVRFLDGDLNGYIPEARMAAVRRSFLNAGTAYLSGSEFFELTCVSELSQILKQMLIFLPKTEQTSSEQAKYNKQVARMSRISTYLEEHHTEPVRLADLAETEGLTPTHVSHFISEHFGMTFQEYLNHIRFEHAIRIMGNPGLTLSDISAMSGFSELKYMTQAFEKQLGMKPAAFRDILLEDPDLAERGKAAKGTSPTEPGTLEYYLSPEETLDILLRTGR